MSVFSLALVFLPAALADPHPTLPKMWRSVTKEDEVGVVFESENFVDSHQITEDNPDAKWTNYTGEFFLSEVLNPKRKLITVFALPICQHLYQMVPVSGSYTGI